jgi:hypothetical protein
VYGLLRAVLEVVVGALVIATIGAAIVLVPYGLGLLIRTTHWILTVETNQGRLVANWIGGLIVIIAIPIVLFSIAGMGALGENTIKNLRRRWR